ncbi:MAG: lamin tail domain-containing protein, partial [bacterium]|nr:lamin tail domain-containing protein [bacterium]
DGNQRKWALPARTFTDGEFLVLWIDGEAGEGDNHASFSLPPGGGSLYLYHDAGGAMELIETVTYPGLGAHASLIRLGGINPSWAATDQPTAGALNPAVTSASPPMSAVELRINEFMADNHNAIEDPDGPIEFDDWLEIYNAGATAVDMSGMYLTDDLGNPTRWQVPQGVTIPAGGYLLFWADDEQGQGPMHTSFQLNGSGEEIGLYNVDGATLIDSITYGMQQPDVSHGRIPDG